MRIPFAIMQAEFKRVLLSLDFTENKAGLVAGIFAENSRDGVYTHGLNRFPAFVKYVKEGHVKKDAEPSPDAAIGALERWNGNYGPGMLNASFCMRRAIELSNQYGIGCVAINNTNHWMRGGTYGWQAAEAGYIAICFTNTIAILPPWGGIEPRLGNNPLVIAVPRNNGHVVLDMAVSQFSFGKLLQYRSANKELPLPGGYDKEGRLSVNATDIIESKRLLPVGFYKGSALSMMLDLMVTVLSKGKSTSEITNSKAETGLSQVFICIKDDNNDELSNQLIEQIINYTRSVTLIDEKEQVRYPGENTLKTRADNLREGIPVDESIWRKVLEL